MSLAAAAVIALVNPAAGPGTVRAGSPVAPRAVQGSHAVESSPGFKEHRYRIIGRLRLGLFSITRDGVGSARFTWRSDGARRVLTLLVGSEPQHAPRGLNQWGYVREEVRSADATDVFSVRSIDEDGAGSDTAFSLGDGPSFAISCASLKGLDLHNAQTTVKGTGVTYRMFDRLLDSVPDASTWKTRRTQPPAGTDAGFLTALHDAVRRLNRGEAKSTVSVPYVYDAAIYDLIVRDTQPLGPTRVETRTFPRLTQTDFAIRNRATGGTTRFAATHAPDPEETSLPVQIFYRPSFWIGVELRLDEKADVPVDPDADPAVRARIRAVCGSASEPGAPG